MKRIIYIAVAVLSVVITGCESEPATPVDNRDAYVGTYLYSAEGKVPLHGTVAKFLELKDTIKYSYKEEYMHIYKLGNSKDSMYVDMPFGTSRAYVSKDGYLCINPTRQDSYMSHIDLNIVEIQEHKQATLSNGVLKWESDASWCGYDPHGSHNLCIDGHGIITNKAVKLE